jgi:1-aminocyclopropane-1-carboxylate deaminase
LRGRTPWRTQSVRSRRRVRVFLKRDDLTNAELPGNKWRKHNLDAAAAGGHGTLLTFGGAYSNHIRAAAHHFGYRTIGVVRGEEHPLPNPTLAFAVERGMTLDYFRDYTGTLSEVGAVGDD